MLFCQAGKCKQPNDDVIKSVGRGMKIRLSTSRVLV